MANRKIVVALGGNAILSSDPSAKAQQEALVETAKHLVKLIKNGDDLIITHGNGPQVGNLLLQQLAANSEKNPAFPLDSLVAMTEGSIGFWLQQAFHDAFMVNQMNNRAVSVITQTIVSLSDPAFQNPTKPIGPFYSEDEAKTVASERGYTVKEDAGRGWRRGSVHGDRARAVVVRQGGGRADEHAVGERGGFVDEGVVLDLAARPHAHSLTDVGATAHNAVTANLSVLSHLC